MLNVDKNRQNEQPMPDTDVRTRSGDRIDSTTDTVNADDDFIVTRFRPEGNKAAKRARRTSSSKKQPDDTEADNVSSALSAWTATYQAVAERMHALADKLSNIEMDIRDRKSDLETFRVLFSESSGAFVVS
jgi:hypothetical protein